MCSTFREKTYAGRFSSISAVVDGTSPPQLLLFVVDDDEDDADADDDGRKNFDRNVHKSTGPHPPPPLFVSPPDDDESPLLVDVELLRENKTLQKYISSLKMQIKNICLQKCTTKFVYTLSNKTHTTFVVCVFISNDAQVPINLRQVNIIFKQVCALNLTRKARGSKFVGGNFVQICRKKCNDIHLKS